MQTIVSVRCRFEEISKINHAPAVDPVLHVCQKCSDGLDRLAIAVLGDLR